MTIDERLERLADRQRFLEEALEVLTAAVNASVAETCELQERDRNRMKAIAQQFREWAD